MAAEAARLAFQTDEYPPMYIETPPPYEFPPISVLTLATQLTNKLSRSSIFENET
jgi:hypothetical protein